MFPEFDKLEFKNYKSFVDYTSIYSLKRVNVFIGRNNSGKSSCLDVLQSFSDKAKMIDDIAVNMYYKLDDSDYNLMLKQSGYVDKWEKPDKKAIVTKNVKLSLQDPFIQGDNRRFSCNENRDYFSKYTFNIDCVSDKINESISRIKFFRLNAERDITPEKEKSEVVLSETGVGAANVIHHILHYNKYDEKLVRKDLLEALNIIMNPDSNFSDITIQKVNEDKWEIFLYEGDNRFPLSKMGSGLKTIILVLLNIFVMPYISMNQTIPKGNVEYNNIIFAFEELENNLHPALQRRLYDYIYKFSIEHNTTVLLTTHSHVAINLFADIEESQLYHVIKENGKSSIHKVEDYITKCEILNDLDVKASDLLQSNGIIWVEGPSDKVYIKRWLELWGDKTFVEGVHYQFLYYGGKILSHFTADPNSKADNLISILSTNRNSAIVIDSDICSKKKNINLTKSRIKKEFEAVNMFCWITKGKEIENYIPYQAINSAYGSNLSRQCEATELFSNYIKQVIHDSVFNKVKFSHEVVKYINDGNSETLLDVRKMITKLCDEIKKWNDLS